MTRRRWAAAAFGLAVLIGAAGLVAAYSRLVVLAAFDLPLVVACAVWLLVLVAVVLYRPSRRQVLVGALPVLALAYVTIGTSFMVTVFDDRGGTVVRTVRTGRYEVRLVTEAGFLDPEWHVRVRTRNGLLSREWTVEEVRGPDPAGIVVTGERSVRVTDVEGRVYDVTF